jgi:hypothetical protein
MLSSQNGGKYFTETWKTERADGEWDSSTLTAADIAFYEVHDGQGKRKDDAIEMMSIPVDPLTTPKLINLEEDPHALLYGH